MDSNSSNLFSQPQTKPQTQTQTPGQNRDPSSFALSHHGPMGGFSATSAAATAAAAAAPGAGSSPPPSGPPSASVSAASGPFSHESYLPSSMSTNVFATNPSAHYPPGIGRPSMPPAASSSLPASAGPPPIASHLPHFQQNSHYTSSQQPFPGYGTRTSVSTNGSPPTSSSQPDSVRPSPGWSSSLSSTKMTESSSHDTPFAKDHEDGAISDGASPSSPGSSKGSETESRKNQVAESQNESERYLMALASKIPHSSLAECASKIKRMDADSTELRNDPIFGSLCNIKDIKQEKHHQVFGLAWLNESCEASPAAVVPRNRIYSRYVQVCGQYTLSPLMPAAFGRLVRLLFPNLATRRLGMRGKSKYHYCGVKLKGENSSVDSPLSTNSPSAVESPQALTLQTSSQVASPAYNQVVGTPVSFVNVQEHFLINDFKYIPGLYGMIERSMTTGNESKSLNLPPLYSYFPKDYDYDPDIADTLYAFVKIQCTAMFDSIRYMRKDDLFRAMMPSPAILTGSLFKLLNTDYVMEWVKDCDLIMYRAMIKMLSRLHLKTINKEIVAVLREISVGFVGRLSAALADRFSQNYIAMKLKFARQFIKLVGRLLRCIETGYRASMVLSNASDRNTMLSDWSKLNFHDTVLREMPCGADTSRSIISILEIHVAHLLKENTPEGCALANYAAFLFKLPGVFPNVNPWLFSLLLSNLLTSFIREMSMVGSRSFKLWWIVGCWINEYMSWSFELGGYLHDEFCSSKPLTHTDVDLDIGINSNISGSIEYNTYENPTPTVDLLEGSLDNI
ncbi:hypothetical protein JCM33374_g4027 [Metschnikowia sp. JCM 33374]|nr:hypothetical protein JCM33374_g4027 [Metschnikowia sp. JCM 33374]